MSETRNKTRKMKNKIFAMEAAPAAIPPNPNMAAIIATTRKITVQRNIIFLFSLLIIDTFYNLYRPTTRKSTIYYRRVLQFEKISLAQKQIAHSYNLHIFRLSHYTGKYLLHQDIFCIPGSRICN